MMGNVGINVVSLHEFRSQRRRVTVSSNQRNTLGDAATRSLNTGQASTADIGQSHHRGLQIKCLDGFVDCVLGHLAVGGPFTAGAGQETGRRDADEVVANQGLGVLGLGISDKRSDA